MAFITSGGTVIAYAEASDVKDKDQRLFEQNEVNFTDVPDAPGSLNNYIEDLTQNIWVLLVLVIQTSTIYLISIPV